MVELTTEYAFPALIDHLTRRTNANIERSSESLKHLTLSFDSASSIGVANRLTEWLLDEWLIDWLKDDLRQKVAPSEWEDTEHLVLMSVYEVKSGSNTISDRTYEEWAQETKESLQRLLETCNSMSIEGFVRFRLRPFVEKFREQIFHELNQLLLDKEYEESVDMLRLMLDSHPKGKQEMHVFCTPTRVWLTDPSGLLIRDDEVSTAAFHASDEEVDSEDLAMSILIARSPRNIVLHDIYPNAVWPSFSETLKRVFEERVTDCGHCSTCRELELMAARGGEDTSKHHHFGPQP